MSLKLGYTGILMQPRNLSLGGIATQSTIDFGRSAERAIDGNKSGSLLHCSQTSMMSDPWWELDIGKMRRIKEIRIWNRVDLTNLLDNFRVFISSSNFVGRSYSSLIDDLSIWRYLHNGPATLFHSIPVNGLGRYIRVQLNGLLKVLSLVEVEVIGI